MVRWSGGTRLGTIASLAGDHSRVSTSSTSEASTRPIRLCTNGRHTIDRGPAEVAGDHHPLAVPPVDEHAGQRAEEEAGHDAGRHHQADGAGAGAGLVAADVGGQQDDGREPEPVAGGRDDLHEPQPEELVRAEQPHVPAGPFLGRAAARRRPSGAPRGTSPRSARPAEPVAARRRGGRSGGLRPAPARSRRAGLVRPERRRSRGSTSRRRARPARPRARTRGSPRGPRSPAHAARDRRPRFAQGAARPRCETIERPGAAR